MVPKNVVIVGAGPFGGGKVASELAKVLPSTHRVVLIDRRSFAYVTSIAARAAVVKGWERDCVVPINDIFPSDSRHVVLAPYRVLAFDGKSVTLDKPAPDFGTTIEADALIIATASTYSFPANTSESSIEAARAQLVKAQEEVAKAKRVLVVGGGPYGVEYAGEVADEHKGKSITLVTSRKTLIGEPFGPKLGASLAKQLTGRGVEIIYDDSIDETFASGPISPRTIKTRKGVSIPDVDYVLTATGSKTDSSLVSERYPELVGKDGRIRVKATFQLDADGLDRVFGVGDIIDLNGLPRTGVVSVFQAPVLVKNVVALLAGKPLTNYKAGKNALFVTVGTTGGAADMFGWTMPSWFVRMLKSKTLMKSKTHDTYGYKPVAA